MITPAPIETQICQRLQQVTEDLYIAGLQRDAEWTNAIKTQLRDLGWDLGYDVCTSGFNGETDPEWLYDLVWYQENEQGFLMDVPLVAESEWQMRPKDIKFDFEKLLAARANHRLMVCQCRKKFKEERLQYFRAAVKVYRHRLPGDRYLIALLDFMDASFHFELIVLTDPDTVEFLSIELPEEAKE